MKVECSIGLEPFQSSEAIASGKCGHVSSTKHASHAGLTRLSAVSHRNEQDGLHLTRLFFTQSSTSRDTFNQRDIDELQARIVELTADCRRKQNSVIALVDAECRQKMSKIDELTVKSRQKDEREELTEASDQKNVTISTLTKSNQERAELIVEQAARFSQLTKALERMEALNEQKMRAHEQTIAGLEAKVKTLELNSATSEETNAALTMLNRQHAAAAIRRY